MLDLQLMFQASKLQSPAYWLVRSPSSSIPNSVRSDERNQLTTRLIQVSPQSDARRRGTRPAQVAQSEANPISAWRSPIPGPGKRCNTPSAEICSISLD